MHVVSALRSDAQDSRDFTIPGVTMNIAAAKNYVRWEQLHKPLPTHKTLPAPSHPTAYETAKSPFLEGSWIRLSLKRRNSPQLLMGVGDEGAPLRRKFMKAEFSANSIAPNEQKVTA
jgi:hypothetical protein